jgi:hypothetical protein
MGNGATAKILPYPPADRSLSAQSATAPQMNRRLVVEVHLSGLNSGSPYFSYGAVVAEAIEFALSA